MYIPQFHVLCFLALSSLGNCCPASGDKGTPTPLEAAKAAPSNNTYVDVPIMAVIGCFSSSCRSCFFKTNGVLTYEGGLLYSCNCGDGRGGRVCNTSERWLRGE